MKGHRSLANQAILLLSSLVLTISGVGFLLNSALVYLDSVEVLGRLPDYDKDLIRQESFYGMIAGITCLVGSFSFFILALLKPSNLSK